MMKFWTYVPVYCNYCCGTFHRLKLDKSVDTPRFELWNLNQGETFRAHIETELAKLPPALKLDSSNQNSKLCPWLSEPFFYHPGPLMRAFHVRPPNICIPFLISFFSSPSSSSPSSSSVLFLAKDQKYETFLAMTKMYCHKSLDQNRGSSRRTV